MFVNLTKQTITELTSGKVYYPSLESLRLTLKTELVNIHNGSPIKVTKVTAIKGLPDPEKGVYYIVPALAFEAIPAWRTDIVATGTVVRDDNGKVIGCNGFRTR